MLPVNFNKFYTEKILKKLWTQRDIEKFCDVVLIGGTEETRIPVHSCVLSAASEYFDRMFMSVASESSTEFNMTSVDCEILQLLVQYCYTGLLAISEDRVVELLQTAEMLLLRDVVTICANYLGDRLHPSNCLGFAILAEQHRCEILLQKAKDYSLEHFMEVRETEEFLNLNAEQLGEFLGSDKLSASFEKDVFKALKDWIDHNRVEREKHQAKLLKLVRLPLLGRSFLKEHVKPICTSMECLQIYTEALEQNLSHDYVQQNERNLVKRRKSKQFLMGITLTSNLYIHYYCPQQLKWMKWSKDLEYRWWPGVAFGEDNFYLVGGFQLGEPLNTVVCLNLKTMKLTDVRPMLEHRGWCGAAVLNGFLYAVGGRNNNDGNLHSVEKWNPNSNTWSKVAAMGVHRCAFGLAVLNEKLYAVGGTSSQSLKLKSAEFYDPLQDVWKPIASMHKARSNFGMAVSNGLLYAVGNWAGSDTVESYNPDTNRWTMVCSLNDSLMDFESCTTFRDRVIVFHKNRVEEYDEETNEWKTTASLKVLHDNHRVFTYSGELLTSSFVEN